MYHNKNLFKFMSIVIFYSKYVYALIFLIGRIRFKLINKGENMSTSPISGSELEDLKLMAQNHFWPHAKPAGDMSEETGLKTITSGKGVWLYDE